MTATRAARPPVLPPPAPPRPPPRARPTSAPVRLTSSDLLAAIGVGATLVATWPLVEAWDGPHPVQVVPVVAHATGMLAGYAILVLIGLMSRAPALELGVGADVLTRWHARGGRIAMTLIAVHAAAATQAWASAKHETTVLALWHVEGLPYLAVTTVGTLLLVAAAVASVRSARQRLPYERWHALHLLTYVGVALSFVHQLAGPDVAGHRLLQLAWALLYAHVFGLALRHRVLTPLQQAWRHRLRVAAVVPEGSGVVSIVVAGHHLDELEAEAGQFLRWRFLTRSSWANAHPFSLSAAPTDGHLRLTVKALGRGSADLHHLVVGTRVLAEGPYGAMTAARRTRDDVLLIAGGVGITPMRALFETLPLAPGQDLTLLYRARRADELVFRRELDDLARHRGARVHYLLGDDRTCLSAATLQRNVPRLAERDVYLCGPPAMAAAVRAALRTAGLPERQLHEERFAW